jgi:hypothetical protein
VALQEKVRNTFVIKVFSCPEVSQNGNRNLRCDQELSFAKKVDCRRNFPEMNVVFGEAAR